MELRTVRYAGDKVSFQIPAHWVQEQDDDGEAYFDPTSQSVILRLSILDVQPPESVKVLNEQAAIDLLSSLESFPEQRIEPCFGGAVRFYKVAAREGECDLILYRWEIAHPIPSYNIMRIPLFALTTLLSQQDDPIVMELIKLFDRELRCVIFLRKKWWEFWK